MQTAALLQKPMHLGEGFEDIYDFNYDSQDPSQGDSFIFTTGGMDAAVVDTSGNVSTQSG